MDRGAAACWLAGCRLRGAALEVHQQQRDRRWRHATDARSLADGVGKRPLELEEYLSRETPHAVVVEAFGNGGGLVPPLALDLVALALQVAGVLGLHFHLRGDLGVVDRRSEFGHAGKRGV